MIKKINLSLIEIILFCVVVFLLVLGILWSDLRTTIKSTVLIPIYSWAILALFGVLTRSVKHSFNVYWGGNPRQKNGYPLIIRFSSRGGFICQNPINVEAEVVDIVHSKDNVDEGKKRFKNNFDEFSIFWLGSQSCIRKKGTFFTEQPETGAILIDIQKCSGKSEIEFTSPGGYGVNFMYRKKGGEIKIDRIKQEDLPLSFIHVSPPEVLHNIRLGNVTYGLALFVAGFGLFSLLNAIWQL